MRVRRRTDGSSTDPTADGRTVGPRLRGRRIVIDPGHGGPDPGVRIAGVAEADLVWDLARRLEGRTTGAGMDALLTRCEHTCPTEAERAALAQGADADLLLSLHVEADPSMDAEGLATFHQPGSTAGETLAGYVRRELASRTGMLDRGTQPHAGLVPLAGVPTVRVEVGYLSNMGDRRRLLDPVFRDVVAEGVLVGIKRFYLQGEDDQPTGTFTFSDVLAREIGRNRPSPADDTPAHRR